MKSVLIFLYNNREIVFTQAEIIASLHGEVTPSRKASMSRTIKILREKDLVSSRKAYYSEQFNSWIVQRIKFYITKKGEYLVKTLINTKEKKE